MKKILALVLALALVLSCASALAADLVGASMPTKDLQRWNQDGDNMEKLLKEAATMLNCSSPPTTCPPSWLRLRP